jgi:antitoxin ParD1/3/4
MHVSLTPKLERLVRRKVKAGFYNNASEVVREALRLMAARDEADRAKRERLREALIAGEQSGLAEDFSMDRLTARLDAEVKRGAARRG